MIKKNGNFKASDQSINSLTRSSGSSTEKPPETPVTKPPPKVTLPRVAAKIPSLGSCFYHPNLQAAFICARCGRQICRTCAKPRGDMVLCPECDAKFPAPLPPAVIPPRRAVIGFIFSIVAGALILINALLLETYFVDLAQIFPWLLQFDTTFLTYLGVTSAIVIIIGAIILYMPTFEVIGALLVLIFSIIAILVGGGFIAGLVSGLIGGIMAILKK
ncbi:MAG: hypothetical protein QW791_05245 [Candidatus Bathyarchaeia archaeon]